MRGRAHMLAAVLVLAAAAPPTNAEMQSGVMRSVYDRAAAQRRDSGGGRPYTLPPLEPHVIADLCSHGGTGAADNGVENPGTQQHPAQDMYYRRATGGGGTSSADESHIGLANFLQYVDKRTHQYMRQYQDTPLHPAVLRECQALNESGVVVMLSGPPGAGKSAIMSLALHYGFDGKETEQGTSSGTCQAKLQECLRLRQVVQGGDAPPCTKKEACNSAFTRTHVFEPLVQTVDHLLIVGGGGLYQPRGDCSGISHKFGRKLADKIPEEMVSVMMAPDATLLKGPRLHHTEAQRNSSYAAAQMPACQAAFDTVISNAGCEQSGLLEVCRAARTYLDATETLLHDADLEERRRRVAEFYRRKRLRLVQGMRQL